MTDFKLKALPPLTSAEKHVYRTLYALNLYEYNSADRAMTKTWDQMIDMQDYGGTFKKGLCRSGDMFQEAIVDDRAIEATKNWNARPSQSVPPPTIDPKLRETLRVLVELVGAGFDFDQCGRASCSCQPVFANDRVELDAHGSDCPRGAAISYAREVIGAAK